MGQPTLIQLPIWTEVVGTFQGLTSNKSHIYIKIDDKMLTFSRESMELKTMLNKLSGELIGQKIGLLHCDDLTKPLRIRVVNR